VPVRFLPVFALVVVDFLARGLRVVAGEVEMGWRMRGLLLPVEPRVRAIVEVLGVVERVVFGWSLAGGERMLALGCEEESVE